MKKLLISLATLAIVLSGCKKSENNAKKNTINIPLSGEISTLDPANAYDTVSAAVVYQCYEQLYQYHYLKRPYTIIPLLAEGMPKASNNGKTYTIKIKKGIKYHDDPAFGGKPRFVKAQDFVTQIKRLAFIPTKSNGWWLFDGKIKGLNEWRNAVKSDFEAFKNTPIKGLRTPDDHTLIFELTEAYPQMLYALTMSFTSPMPIEAVEKYENLLNDRIVGTGPFKLKTWTKFSNLKLTKNTEYREAFYPTQGDRLANSRKLLRDAGRKIPFIDGVNFQIIKEAQTRWLNFKAKKIDLLVIPKDNYTSAIDPSGGLKKDLKKEGVRLQVFPTLTYWWLSFNMNDPLLGKNKLLRQAIAHAMDIDKYIQIFTNNIGQKANSIYPPGIPGYDPNSQLPYRYDLEKAKELLAKAGYPEGEGLPVLTFDLRGTSTTNRQRAEFIKSQLANIGVQVTVLTNTFPAFLKKAKNGDLQFWQDGWAMDYPDAENVLQLLLSKNKTPGPNVTNYNSPKFDKLFNQLKTMEDGKEKHQVMQEIEKIIADDLPWVMQHYARNYILYHNRLENYRHSDLIYNNMKYLRIKGN